MSTYTVPTVIQQRDIPETISSVSALAGHDYVDLFTVTATGATEHSPEQWARVALEGVSSAAGFIVWQVLCGLRLEKQPSPDYVAGWKIADRGDNWIRLEAASWFMTAHAVVRVDDRHVFVALFVRYDRRAGALIWPPLSIGHRRAMPGLLRHAARCINRGHSPGTGAVDGYLPTYDVRSAHQIEVHAPAGVTYQTARDMDVGRSIPIAVLVTIRALPHLVTGKARPSRSLTLKTFLDIGFVILEESPPAEFVIGAVGKFWRPDSGMVRITRDEFRTFDEPGLAKAILTLTVEERGPSRSLLATETRVACTDSSARRRFFLYWRAIGPFSGWIRRLMLDEVRRTAEGGKLKD